MQITNNLIDNKFVPFSQYFFSESMVTELHVSLSSIHLRIWCDIHNKNHINGQGFQNRYWRTSKSAPDGATSSTDEMTGHK